MGALTLLMRAWSDDLGGWLFSNDACSTDRYRGGSVLQRSSSLQFVTRLIVAIGAAVLVGRLIESRIESDTLEWLLEFVLAGVLVTWTSAGVSRNKLRKERDIEVER